jgi:hypothetical protein
MCGVRWRETYFSCRCPRDARGYVSARGRVRGSNRTRSRGLTSSPWHPYVGLGCVASTCGSISGPSFSLLLSSSSVSARRRRPCTRLEDEGEMEHPALVDRQFRRQLDGNHHHYIWEKALNHATHTFALRAHPQTTYPYYRVLNVNQHIPSPVSATTPRWHAFASRMHPQRTHPHSCPRKHVLCTVYPQRTHHPHCVQKRIAQPPRLGHRNEEPGNTMIKRPWDATNARCSDAPV